MNNYLIFSLMFFNIFLSLPFILIRVFKRKESVFLIALFISVLGFYFRPIGGDLFRYYNAFNSVDSINFFFLNTRDLYAKFLVSFIYEAGLSKYTLGLISAFITYYFSLKAFFIELKEKKIKKWYFLFFIIFFLHIPVTGYTGVRFYPAVSVFTYGIILYFNKEKKGFVYLLLSMLIHFSMSIPVFLLIFYIILKRRFTVSFLKKLALISLVLGLVLNENIILNITQILNQVFFGKEFFSLSYIGGEWGVEYVQKFNTIGYIDFFIQLTLKKLTLVFYLLTLDEKDKRVKYILLLVILTLVLQNFKTPFERYFYIVFPLIIISNIKSHILKKQWKVQGFYLIVFLHNIYVQIMIIKGYYLEYFYSYSNLLKLNLVNVIIDIFNLF